VAKPKRRKGETKRQAKARIRTSRGTPAVKECIHGEPLGTCIKNSNCPPLGTPLFMEEGTDAHDATASNVPYAGENFDDF
jgi:hypothetical protein